MPRHDTLHRELLGRQFAKFVVNEWQEFLGGTRVALLDCGQNARDYGHSGQFYRAQRGSSPSPATDAFPPSVPSTARTVMILRPPVRNTEVSLGRSGRC